MIRMTITSAPIHSEKVGAFVLRLRRSDPQHGMEHPQKLEKKIHF